MVRARKLWVVAFVAGMPIVACSGESGSTGNDGGSPGADAAEARTIREPALRSDARSAFVAELQWSQVYAMSALEGGADSVVAFSHLTRAEHAIAAQIQPFYGAATRDELAALLEQRAQALAWTFAAPESPRATALAVPSDLHANAHAIALFFAKLSPYAWGDLERKLDREIDALTDALQARREGDVARMVRDLDAAEESALVVADTIVFGLRTLFPSAISPSEAAPSSDDFHLDLRVALGDQAFWTRAWAVDHLAKKSVQPELDRAVTASVDVGKAFAAVYGDGVGGPMQAHFHDDTADAVAFVFASESGDATAVSSIGRQWLADGESLAQFLVATVPTLPLADARAETHDAIDRERAMLVARFAGDWEAEASSYDASIASRDALANVVAGGVARSVRLVP